MENKGKDKKKTQQCIVNVNTVSESTYLQYLNMNKPILGLVTSTQF